MPFSSVVSRAFAAANRSIPGILFCIVLFGIPQAMGIILGPYMTTQVQPKPGQPPGPEMLLMMGFGCFSCVWLLVIIFGAPWVYGGILGQHRDHIHHPGQPPGSFSEYAGRCYARMLGMTAIVLGVCFAIMIPIGCIGWVLAMSQLQGPGGQIDPQKMQELAQHPINIAAGVLMIVWMTAIGTLFNPAYVILWGEDESITSSMKKSYRLLRDNRSDAVKLFFVYLLLGMVMWVLRPVIGVLQIKAMPVIVPIGIALGFYVSYLPVLNFGIATSLYLARKPAVEPETADIPEDAAADEDRQDGEGEMI